MSSPKFPILSGDFDSVEITEAQSKLLDILKAFGKMSLIASESSAKFRTEKVGGLESFLYQVGRLTDKTPDKINKTPDKISREQIEELEKEVRYEQREEKVGNKTEFLRVLLGNAHNNKTFTELVKTVIEEQLDLSRKRADNRYLAEQSQSNDLGL